MKSCFLVIISLLIASPPVTQHRYTEKQVIDYAKSIDVQVLDPSLPTQHLEDWLQNGPPRAKILMWIVRDTCQLRPDSSSVDYPLCSEVRVSRNGEVGIIFIQVGTSRKGIVGSPKFDGAGVEEMEAPLVHTGSAERLSELPALLDQPAFAHGVEQLYDEIVARHPVGIPTGAKMVAIYPLLSKRLVEKLELAKTCETDYFQQHGRAKDSAEKPTWLKSGLFSGAGNRALPNTAQAVRDGQQTDGSYQVYVNLWGPSIDIRNGVNSEANSPAGRWQTAVKVIFESGRYVVDDVRLFDGPSTNGPSHLLSESFAGCEGAHWAGLTASNK
jgi:hypothetical protein